MGPVFSQARATEFLAPAVLSSKIRFKKRKKKKKQNRVGLDLTFRIKNQGVVPYRGRYKKPQKIVFRYVGERCGIGTYGKCKLAVTEVQSLVECYLNSERSV